MIRVQEQDFDVGAEMAALTKGGDSGAVVSFTGRVRGGSGDSAISAMTLEHYPGMTEKALEAIEKEAHARWPLDASLIIHRFGRLEPGENIVLVITCSAHRQAAFAAAEYLMDWLKTKAPFWKLEEGPGGARWVDARESDEAATKRWG